MLGPDAEVSRRDTALSWKAALDQLPLGCELGRRGWVHRAMTIRVANSRRDRHIAADIVKRQHYLGCWPCKPRRLIVSYLADLGASECAGLVMVVLQPGQYHVARPLGLKQYEILSLCRLWRASDLGPAVAPDFTPEMVRRVAHRVRSDWCALKLRPGGLRAPPRLLVAYADPEVGHDGGVYLGSGATYCGPGEGGKHLFAWALDSDLLEPLREFGK